MPVYKDSERKTWYVKTNYTDWQGNYKSKVKRGFKTKKEALQWEADTLAKYRDYKATFSVDELAALFLEYKKTRVKPSTYVYYRNNIKKHISPYFGSKKVADVSLIDTNKWQDETLAKGISPETFKQLQVILKTLYAFAEKYYDLKDNPLKAMDYIKVDARKKKEKADITFWTASQFQTFIQSETNEHYKMLYNTLYWSGMRIGELLALTWEDVDIERKTIRINKTMLYLDGEKVVQTPKSVRSLRTIKMPGFYMEWLKDYKNRSYDNSPECRVFAFIQAANTVNNHFKKLSKKLGLPYLTEHGLRHSHASYLINMGTPAIAIAGRLGDSIETVLKVYAHLFEEVSDRVADTLDNSYQIRITQ